MHEHGHANENSRCKETSDIPTGGVVSNFVTFHWLASGNDVIFFASHESLSALSGVYTSSEMAGMLLRLTEPTRDTRVTANVALRSGSSQHGNDLLAAVGCKDASANY